ncbi:MAG: hypothetical protein WA892_08285 [Ornithinimicrobium sp.]
MKLWPVLILLLLMATASPMATAQGGGEGSPEDLLTDQARRVSGGSLVTLATPVEPGVAFADSVLDEQARWYAFYVAQGKQVDVEMAEDGTLDYGCCVELRLYAPDQETDYGREGGYSDGVAKIYRTGTGADGAVTSGTHYVSVELDDIGPVDGELGYQLKVSVGESAADSSTEGTVADPSTDDEQAAAEASDQGSQDAGARASEDQGSIDMLLTLLIAMGVLVMALGGAVIFLLVRLARQ